MEVNGLEERMKGQETQRTDSKTGFLIKLTIIFLRQAFIVVKAGCWRGGGSLVLRAVGVFEEAGYWQGEKVSNE